MNISARQLRAFVALSRLRSFTKAADLVHLSQPAFSALIRGLEQAVGSRLFHRDTRNVALTVEGRAFEATARRVLQELELGLAGLQDLGGLRFGQVRLAMLPSLAAGWLPPLLARFMVDYPDLTVQVYDQLSDRAIERVRSGEADFGIVAMPAEDHELTSQRLCSDRFELVCHQNHRLARSRSLTVKDLAGERFAYQARYGIVGRYLESELPPLHRLPPFEVEQLATVIGMVRSDLCVAVIPQFNLYDFHYPELVRRPLMWRGLQRHLYVVRPRGRLLSQAAQAMLDHLQRNLPSQGRRLAP